MSANIASTPPPKEIKKNGKHRSLTLRERKFIKYLPESKTITEAMRKSGYSENTINAIGSHNTPLCKPHVLSAIQRAMEKQGISDDMLAKKIKDGMSCYKVVTATEKGIITDEKSFPDYPTQHKYLDTALLLRSDYPSEKVEVEHTGQVLVVHIPVKGEGWQIE